MKDVVIIQRKDLLDGLRDLPIEQWNITDLTPLKRHKVMNSKYAAFVDGTYVKFIKATPSLSALKNEIPVLIESMLNIHNLHTRIQNL